MEEVVEEEDFINEEELIRMGKEICEEHITRERMPMFDPSTVANLHNDNHPSTMVVELLHLHKYLPNENELMNKGQFEFFSHPEIVNLVTDILTRTTGVWPGKGSLWPTLIPSFHEMTIINMDLTKQRVKQLISGEHICIFELKFRSC